MRQQFANLSDEVLFNALNRIIINNNKHIQQIMELSFPELPSTATLEMKKKAHKEMLESIDFGIFLKEKLLLKNII